MNLLKSIKCILSFIGFTLLANTTLVHGFSARLEKDVLISDLSGIPNNITFSIYDSEIAVIPLATEIFIRGEWFADYNFTKFTTNSAEIARFKADFSNTSGLPKNEDLWLEIEVDGVVKGSRELIKHELWALFSEDSKWALNGSQLYYQDGNVGIGTSNPAESLQVSGNMQLSPGGDRSVYTGARTAGEFHAGYDLTVRAGNFGGLFGGPGTTPGGDLFLSAGFAGGFNAAKGGDVVVSAGAAGGTLGTADGGQIYLFGGIPVASGTDGDVIIAHTGTESRGNVGIGTVDPEAKLEVYSLIEQLQDDLVKFNAGSWNDRSIKFGMAQGQAYIGGFDEAGNSPRSLVLQPEGHNVGIGTTNPTFTLELAGCSGGNCAAKPDGTTWTISSDMRLKDFHGVYTRGLDAIGQIIPMRYSYKVDNSLGLSADQKLIGLTAQNVQRVIPEAVSTDDYGYLRMNADPVLWTMLNAINELRQENEILRQELGQLRTRIDEFMR